MRLHVSASLCDGVSFAVISEGIRIGDDAMKRRASWWLAGLAWFGCACAAQDMPRATLSDKPLSQRVVAYVIEARVDAAKHTLDGSETLTWNNLTVRAQD